MEITITGSTLINWEYQKSEVFSSDDEDSQTESIIAVPETELREGVRDEDIQRQHEGFSNQLFGKKWFPRQNPWVAVKMAVLQGKASKRTTWGMGTRYKPMRWRWKKGMSVRKWSR